MKHPTIGDTFQYDFSFTENQILTFASISGDTNPIHVNEQYGEDSIFGKCIVHGYFSISVFSKVYGTLLYPDEHILINQSASYIKPIFTEIEYSAIFKILKIFPEKNRVLYRNEIIDKNSSELKVTGETMLMNKRYYNW